MAQRAGESKLNLESHFDDREWAFFIGRCAGARLLAQRAGWDTGECVYEWGEEWE